MDGSFKVGDGNWAITTTFLSMNQLNNTSFKESFDTSYSSNTRALSSHIQTATDDSKKSDVGNQVFFKYGHGVLAYNDEFATQLLLKNVRARIEKSLLTE